MQLVFHLGMPKCGTTTLQNTCSTHRDLLKDNGILYPDFSDFRKTYEDLRYRSTGNGNPFIYLIRKRNDPRVAPALDKDEVIEAFRRQLDSANIHTVLLSHEDFCTVSPQELAALGQHLGFELDAVRLFLHIRKHDSWLASDYQQHVKQLRVAHTMQEHIGKRLKAAEFSQVCNRFARIFGADKLCVRLVDRNVIRRNLVFDFFSTLGHRIPELETIDIADDNQAIDPFFLEVLRAANARNTSAEEFHALMKFYLEFRASDEGANVSRFALPSDSSTLVHTYFAEDRARLSPYLTSRENELLETLHVDKRSRNGEEEHAALDMLLFHLRQIGTVTA